MSDEIKRDLVLTILELADPNLADDNKELQIQAHFVNKSVKHIRGELFKISKLFNNYNLWNLEVSTNNIVFHGRL